MQSDCVEINDRSDNGKATQPVTQFEVDFIDNVNIKEVYLGKKGLHLHKKVRIDLIGVFYKNHGIFDGLWNT